MNKHPEDVKTSVVNRYLNCEQIAKIAHDNAVIYRGNKIFVKEKTLKLNSDGSSLKVYS